MSNSYETITMLQDIPEHLINPSDRSVLEGMGFTLEKTPEGNYYLYCPDYGANPLDMADLSTFNMAQLKNDYPDEEPRPEWVKALIAVDREEDVLAMHALLEERDSGWMNVLQGILNKSQNVGPDALNAIEGKAAYWADRDRPGEFGGWCCRITRDGYQIKGVDHILEEMAKDAERAQSQGKPFVINERASPEQPFFEVLVTRDTSESCFVGVYADNKKQAADLATTKSLLLGAPFALNDGDMDEPVYLGDLEYDVEQIDPPPA